MNLHTFRNARPTPLLALGFQGEGHSAVRPGYVTQGELVQRYSCQVTSL
jgi:hypothetical protein